MGVSISGATPIAGWIMENPMNMDDLGVPLFQETFDDVSMKPPQLGMNQT